MLHCVGSTKNLLSGKEEEVTKELAAVFELFDRDGKGVVRAEELKALFFALGIKVSKKRVQRLLAKENLKATLSLEDVTRVCEDLLRIRPPIDRDDDVVDLLLPGGGSLALETLVHANDDFGLGIPKAELQAIVGDGTYGKEDVLRMLREETQRRKDEDEIAACHRRRKQKGVVGRPYHRDTF